MTKADGGPAFPIYGSDNDSGDGMRLRDWFAGQALVGLLEVEGYGAAWAAYATEAYLMADAMIAERSKKVVTTREE